jgi:hypothetical protein
LNYCWIQKSIVQNVASRSFKRARDQLNHIDCSYTFLPTACTTLGDDLDWDDFVEFYKLSYSIVAILEHVITNFPNFLHFLDSWVVDKEEKGIPLVGLKRTPTSC